MIYGPKKNKITKQYEIRNNIELNLEFLVLIGSLERSSFDFLIQNCRKNVNNNNTAWRRKQNVQIVVWLDSPMEVAVVRFIVIFDQLAILFETTGWKSLQLLTTIIIVHGWGISMDIGLTVILCTYITYYFRSNFTIFLSTLSTHGFTRHRYTISH